MPYLIILLIVSCIHPAYATVACSSGTWSGGASGTCTGGTHPLTYTVTGAAGVGTLSEVQAVFNDACRGDTVKLEADTRWSGSLIVPIQLCGSAGYLTITTTEDAKLPAEGTRITPAYKSLLPELSYTTGTALSIVRTAYGPVTHVKVRGVLFTPPDDGSGSSLVVKIGDNSGVSPGEVDLTGGYLWQNVSGNGRPIVNLTASVPLSSTTIFVDDGSWATPGMKITISASNGGTRERHRIVESSTPTSITVTVPTSVVHNSGDVVIDSLVSDSQQPDDIIFQHVVFLNGFHTYHVPFHVNNFIVANARSFSLLDSFLDGAYGMGQTEGHGVLSNHGVGPYTIENNYIHGSTENIMFGGSRPGYEAELDSAEIRYNYFPHIQERELIGERNGEYGMGRLRMAWRGLQVFPSAGSTSNYFVATNTGEMCETEPPLEEWNAVAVAGTITDCGVVWRRLGNNDYFAYTKNNFEIKSAKGINLQYNVFDGHWGIRSDSQFYAINFKSANGGQYCDYDEIPFPNCYGSYMNDITMRNNLLKNIASGFISILPSYTGFAHAENVKIYDNLFIAHPTANNIYSGVNLMLVIGPNHCDGTAFVGDCGRIGYEWVAPNTGVAFEIYNNTFVVPTLRTSNSSLTIERKSTFQYWSTTYQRISGNIMQRQSASHSSRSPATGDASPSDVNSPGGRGALLNALGCVLPCSDKWHKNIINGGINSTAAFPAGSVLNQCAGTSACTPNWNYVGTQSDGLTTYSSANGNLLPALFKNYAAGNYRVSDNHAWAKRATPDTGVDVGADMSQIPQIRSLSVVPTDRSVLFRYSVTDPIDHIPCVIEVHTAPDYETTNYLGGTTGYVGELSQIGTYYRQDADDADRFPRVGAQRMLIVGHSVNLAADTDHWYRLQCGGDSVRGKFRTLSTLSGTKVQTVEQPTTGTLTWGCAYSRATNTISAGGCTGGSVSATASTPASFTATRGRIVYWRVGTGHVKALAVL